MGRGTKVTDFLRRHKTLVAVVVLFGLAWLLIVSLTPYWARDATGAFLKPLTERVGMTALILGALAVVAVVLFKMANRLVDGVGGGAA